jgi:hypothetical protein
MVTPSSRASSGRAACSLDAAGAAAGLGLLMCHTPDELSFFLPKRRASGTRCSRQVRLLDSGQLRQGSKRRHVPALFGDVDAALLVDSDPVWDKVAGYAPDHFAIARPYHVDLVLGYKERASAQDRLEASRLVPLDRTREDVAEAW